MQELFFRLAFVLVFNIYTYTKEGEAVEAAKEEVDVKKRKTKEKPSTNQHIRGIFIYIIYLRIIYKKDTQK